MFSDTLALAIDRAPLKHLDYLARQLWSAHANGILDDDQAQGLAEALADRQREGSRPGPQNAPATAAVARVAYPPRRPQRSPDRQRSIERRRRLAASGPMPPALASRFTVGELAALRIVGDAVRERGLCALHVDAIAARAGVCRTTAQNAIREAKRLGLLTVEERRRRGQPSLTNLVRIVSGEWLAWLRIGNGRPVRLGPGFKFSSTTDSRFKQERFRSAAPGGASSIFRKEGA
jgi:hypothetical protein